MEVMYFERRRLWETGIILPQPWHCYSFFPAHFSLNPNGFGPSVQRNAPHSLKVLTCLMEICLDTSLFSSSRYQLYSAGRGWFQISSTRLEELWHARPGYG